MKKYISVFFAGTSHSLDLAHLAGSLFDNTIEDKKVLFKKGFHGCGLVYGITGALFASGLDEQCEEVIEGISQFIAEGHEVVLNVYGHSRGGMAAIMLAQQLSLVDPEKLEINLALMDPVPGNLIISANLDPFDTTLANKGMDLTSCKPLANVLALYPYEPLADLEFHAPLFISYPSHVNPEEVIIPGCHAGAENLWVPETKITSSLVKRFFFQNGTEFLDGKTTKSDKRKILACYEKALKQLDDHGPQQRDAHSAKGIYIDAQTHADYFNEHHRQLAKGSRWAILAVSLKQSNNPLSFLKRTQVGQILGKALAWLLFGVGLAAIVFFTGGLAGIPAIAYMGTLSILAVAPILSTSLALLWYGLVKPVVSPLLHRFLYPKYSIRNINLVEPSESEETLSSSSESEYTSEESYEGITQSLYQSLISIEGLLSNPAVKEMLSSELAYNNVLKTLFKALNKTELVKNNQTFLELQRLVGKLHQISYGLLVNSKKGIEEVNTPEVCNELRIRRGELLEQFFKILFIYAPLFKRCMVEKAENPQAFNALDTFLKAQVYENGQKGLDLASHLISPIQRGPKYRMLIQEIHKLGTNLDLEIVDECQETLDLIDRNLNQINKSLEEPSKPSASKKESCWPFWTSSCSESKRVEPAFTHFSKPF